MVGLLLLLLAGVLLIVLAKLAKSNQWFGVPSDEIQGIKKLSDEEFQKLEWSEQQRYLSQMQQRQKGVNYAPIQRTMVFIGATLIILSFAFTSIVNIPKQHTGHLYKRYAAKSMEQGKVIATDGQMGKQAGILQEGFKFLPFVNVLNKVTKVEDISIPKGQLGVLIARDGKPMPEKLYVAPDWVTPDQESERSTIENKMATNAKYFIENGGYKGPQLNVLKPGIHKVNQFLFEVQLYEATNVPEGFVGVVTSKAGSVPENIELDDSLGLAQPVVPKGFMGVWQDVLTPGSYYMNPVAYKITQIDTRIKTWEYKGGYAGYTIELMINDEDGTIDASKTAFSTIAVPSSAADKAIECTTKDSWIVFLEGRMQVQVQPNDAPYLVASIGGLTELEDKVMTPQLRSAERNIAESREAPTFITERSKIENEIENVMIELGEKSRLVVHKFNLTNVYIPPELLVPDKRKQLATKMIKTYQEEKKSNDQKIISEKAKQVALMQPILVKAQLEKEAAKETRERDKLEGEGQKLKMMEIADGQAALRDVLGLEAAIALEMITRAKELPKEAWKTPMFYSTGGGSSDGGGIAGANDAFFGMTINQMMTAMATMGAQADLTAAYNDYKGVGWERGQGALAPEEPAKPAEKTE